MEPLLFEEKWKTNVSSKRLKNALSWVEYAGQQALELFGKASSYRKSDRSVVTEADQKIESYLRKKIVESYPSDSIIGEESSPRPGGEIYWLLDPIDGTASYSMGLPIWAVSVGLKTDSGFDSGIVYAPFLRDIYYGEKPKVFKNGQRLSLREPLLDDREALLVVPSDSHRKYEISFTGKTRSLGSTAFHMVLVLAGRSAGALLGRVHLWDIAGVLGIGTGMMLRGVESGTSPDLDRLMGGNVAKEPLLYTRDNLWEAVRSKIEVRDSPKKD